MISDDDNKVDQGILELESNIGLKKNFFHNLLNEDDWSFIIKLHSFFEAACNHLLLFHLKEPNLSDIISRIDLSSKPIGKINILGKLELIGKKDIRLLTRLSEIRNSLVHDIKNCEFSLKHMVNSFEPKSLKQFAIDFSPFEAYTREFSSDPRLKFDPDPILKNQSDINNVISRALENPKSHIWLGSYHTIITIVDMYSYSDYKNWIKAKSIDDED